MSCLTCGAGSAQPFRVGDFTPNNFDIILRDLGGEYLHPEGWQWFQAKLALDVGTISGTYVNGWVFTEWVPPRPGNSACCTRTAISQSTIQSAGFGFNVTDSTIAVAGMRLQFNFNNPSDPVVIIDGGGFDRISLTIRSEGLTLSRFPETEIELDIKPGSDPNSVNPRSKGVIPVAVLGSTDFDATQVDFTTVRFGIAEASPAHEGHVEDVNDDGYPDMVFHFKTRDTGIICGDTEATLMGEAFGGNPIPITGTDAVKTAGCK